MIARRAKPRGGYSLLELLVYMAVFAIGINLFVSLLTTGSRLTATSTLQVNRQEGLREIQEAFTGYVRRAAEVVPQAGGYTTGEAMVVLRMPAGQPEGFTYLVLGAVRGPDQFTVMGFAEESQEPVYMKTLRQPLGQQQYTVESQGARPLVSLTLHVKQEAGEREREYPVHRTSAVPRGARGEAP